MGLADEVAKDRGQPATVRIGVVLSVAPLIVTAQGTPFREVGVLDGYTPVVGQTVALLGQSSVSSDGSSWLVLGDLVTSSSGVLSAITVASGTDATGVSTASPAYVALAGAFALGAVFTAATSGRALVHWRTSTAAAVGALAWTSFRLGLGSVIGAGTLVTAPSDNVAILSGNTSSFDMGTSTLLTGLIAGTVYNVQMQHRTTAGTSFWGRREIIVVPVP